MYSHCPEQCADFAFGQCSSQHTHSHSEFEKFYNVLKNVGSCIEHYGENESLRSLSLWCPITGGMFPTKYVLNTRVTTIDM